ncbi:MAG: cytochrome c peroxidase [Gallionella sp.]
MLRTNLKLIMVVLVASLLIAVLTCVNYPVEPIVNPVIIKSLNQTSINEPIQPIVPPIGLDKDKVALGETLFNEVKLSANNTISCAHCHNLKTAGMDGLPHSFGLYGKPSLVNAPTIFNAALNIAQFWDGRAQTLEDQLDGPILSKREMGSRWSQVVAKLKADSYYVSVFKKSYPDGITKRNIKNAMATFERSLVTINAPFDRYLRGDTNAISENAKAGYALFKGYGCAACHQGRNVGGNLFEVFGVMGNYFSDRGRPTKADLGRFNVTGLDEDKQVFLVPSLRLVTLTAPYFHDGETPKLHEAIDVMAKYQLGREMPDTDEALIIDFLHTLVGEYKGKRLTP